MILILPQALNTLNHYGITLNLGCPTHSDPTLSLGFRPPILLNSTHRTMGF